MSITVNHQIRFEHLNHHGTLYGGFFTEWMVESAYIATADFRKSTDNIVMAGIKELRLLRPVKVNEILTLTASIKSLGTTSIMVEVSGREMMSNELCCVGDFIFVTTDEKGHKCPHNLSL